MMTMIKSWKKENLNPWGRRAIDWEADTHRGLRLSSAVPIRGLPPRHDNKIVFFFLGQQSVVVSSLVLDFISS